MFSKVGRELRRWLIIIALIIIIRAVFIEAYIIPTPSMETTFLVGDAVLVNHLAYGLKLPFTHFYLLRGRVPRRGELVVFSYPAEHRDYVKRCVAGPGDTVQIIDKVLLVNRRIVSEPYARHQDSLTYPPVFYEPRRFQAEWEKGSLTCLTDLRDIRDNFGPVVIPEEHVFVLGDNRDNSYDSRFWGPLPRRQLNGQPVFIYFSFDPGKEPGSILDIIRFWRWKKIRWHRIFRTP